MNEFQYPEDRSELYEGPNEEEQSLYFSLMDFQQLVERYGVDFVINRLNFETSNKLYEYYQGC
jgi:hypothetical protein